MNLFGFVLDTANWGGTNGIGYRLGEHVAYTVVSVLIAAVIAVPLGLLIGHTGRGGSLVRGLRNAARAIPALGLLVLTVLLLGIGVAPVILVLVVLAIPPILAATAAGVTGADREAVHAARALGMNGSQLVAKIEWPLALPLVISGLRSATLLAVATATIAAYATVGGLGRLIFDGIRVRDYSQTFSGALLVAVLAIVLYVALGLVGWLAARKARPGHRRTASVSAGGSGRGSSLRSSRSAHSSSWSRR